MTFKSINLNEMPKTLTIKLFTIKLISKQKIVLLNHINHSVTIKKKPVYMN